MCVIICACKRFIVRLFACVCGLRQKQIQFRKPLDLWIQFSFFIQQFANNRSVILTVILNPRFKFQTHYRLIHPAGIQTVNSPMLANSQCLQSKNLQNSYCPGLELIVSFHRFWIRHFIKQEIFDLFHQN